MSVAIRHYSAQPLDTSQAADLDRIFFEASAVQHFGCPAERAAFRERWLGRYLLADATHAFLAIDRDGRVVGYVIGSIADIARQPRFADLTSARQFAPFSIRYPAHLHINVDVAYRSQGLGQELVETFALHATALGAPGMHVVTGGSSRNVRFYARCGFIEVARVASGGGDKVFLGRDFQAAGEAAITA